VRCGSCPGAIRTKEGTEKFRGRILSATVRREADRWYVSLTVETERPNLEPILGPVIGVDLGLNSFAVISDGVHEEAVAAPKPLGRSLRLLRRRIKVVVAPRFLASSMPPLVTARPSRNRPWKIRPLAEERR
jgi:hypothetical protein